MIRFEDLCDETGAHFTASTTNSNLVDCHCYGMPVIAENWDVSIWKLKNPDGNIAELQHRLAQLCSISMFGPLKVYLKDDGYRGGYLVVSNDPKEVDKHNYYHEKDCEVNYMTVFPGNSGYEFMGDS